MKRYSLAAAGLLVLAAALPVSAAPKSGCPADASIWSEASVSSATATIWPDLLDPSAFPGGIGDLQAFVAGYDRNGDGDVCLLTMWGEHLNPNSNWYRVGMELLGEPTHQYFIKDNTANAAG